MKRKAQMGPQAIDTRNMEHTRTQNDARAKLISELTSKFPEDVRAIVTAQVLGLIQGILTAEDMKHQSA